MRNKSILNRITFEWLMSLANQLPIYLDMDLHCLIVFVVGILKVWEAYKPCLLLKHNEYQPFQNDRLKKVKTINKACYTLDQVTIFVFLKL